jgi:cytochrome b561
MQQNNIKKFPLSMRLLHWSMVVLLISMVSAGLVMIESLAVWQPTLLALHKGFGALALLLVCIRSVLKMTLNAPSLPSSIPTIQRFAATLSHYVLYGLMFALPISGLFMQYFAAQPVTVFGLVTIPAAITPNISLYAFFRVSHEYFAMGLMGVVGVHLLAALHHHLIKKDEVLQSML